MNDYKLVLLDDDVNSFAYIMACLIRYCKHEPEQAEQCALIADTRGFCSIKHGSYFDMEELRDQLDGLNIIVNMEIDESYMH